MTPAESRAREMVVESGLALEESADLIEQLSGFERYVDDTAPEPSPELAALMSGTLRTVVAAPLSRRRGRVLLAGAVAFGTVAAGGIAAAANELPPTAQRLVAELSERYLPFQIPRPEERGTDEETEDTGRQTPPPEQDGPSDGPGVVGPDGIPGTPTPSQDGRKKPAPSPTPSVAPTPTTTAVPTPTVEPTLDSEPTPAPEGTAVPEDSTDTVEEPGVTETEPAPSETDVTEPVLIGPAPSSEPSPSSEPRPARTDPDATASPTAQPSAAMNSRRSFGHARARRRDTAAETQQ